MTLDRVLRELTIEVTQQCLNHCLFCSSCAVRHPAIAEMPVELVTTLIEDACAHGLQSLSISGGEPFLHPELHGILAAAVRQAPSHASLRHGVARLRRTAVYSSGVVLDAAGRAKPLLLDDRLLALMTAPGVTLVLNVQSLDPAVHDGLVGRRGALALTLRAMTAALRQGVSVEVHIVPNKLNVATLVDTARGLVALGVARVSFLRFVPQGYGAIHRSKLVLSPLDQETLREAIDQLRRDEHSSRYRFGIPLGAPGQCAARCGAGRTRMVVRSDGAIFPCEAYKECGRSEFRLGSVYKERLPELLERATSLAGLPPVHQLGIADPCPAQRLYAEE
jgi:MoaA/NifB/PqqE/SkfB family radical SAM enzyme